MHLNPEDQGTKKVPEPVLSEGGLEVLDTVRPAYKVLRFEQRELTLQEAG